VLLEEIEDPAVGAVDAEELPDQFVDGVGPALVGPNCIGQRAQQGGAIS
jgi:hypothetical protein